MVSNRFYVAEQGNRIIGVIACTDCTGRAMYVTKEDCKRHLGFLRGSIGYRIFTDEFTRPLEYPATTGYIEFVGVLAEARGQGIAKALLKEVMELNPQYDEFVLDVTDINAPAIKSYTDFGFVEFVCVPVKFPKQKGFNAKVYMKYSR
ncbi:MAG: GNAT family N-acetyltransferase [Oscillospiraceae bacterium]|nr:GNAT family N-acetyltransferase [Oscillospiraceae bacterium]